MPVPQGHSGMRPGHPPGSPGITGCRPGGLRGPVWVSRATGGAGVMARAAYRATAQQGSQATTGEAAGGHGYCTEPRAAREATQFAELTCVLQNPGSSKQMRMAVNSWLC